MSEEAKIIVNGVELNSAQSSTLRVALESFSFSLMNEGLGEDEHGLTMVKLYMQRVEEIRKALYKNNPHYIQNS
jgi:hypothetical protein